MRRAAGCVAATGQGEVSRVKVLLWPCESPMWPDPVAAAAGALDTKVAALHACLSYSGSVLQIPRPGWEAVPMRLSMRAEHQIRFIWRGVRLPCCPSPVRSSTAGSAPVSYRKAPPDSRRE
jgi:hypothetical protein